jgi:hypothetical protein
LLAAQLEYQKLVGQYPDKEAQLRQLFKVLCDIQGMAGYTPASVGESHDWTSTINTVKERCTNYCKALFGKTLYSALYSTYTVTLNKLKGLLKVSIFSEEKKSQKAQGNKTRRKASMKFAGISSTAPRRLPTL